MVVFSLCIVFAVILLYKRYVPVRGVGKNNREKLDFGKVTVIDLRDYNESYKHQVEGAINIPIAYLNRYYKEIPKRDLHIIGSNLLEKNVGIRFLRQKGFHVTGFTIIKKNHQDYKENLCV